MRFRVFQTSEAASSDWGAAPASRWPDGTEVFVRWPRARTIEVEDLAGLLRLIADVGELVVDRPRGPQGHAELHAVRSGRLPPEDESSYWGLPVLEVYDDHRE